MSRALRRFVSGRGCAMVGALLLVGSCAAPVALTMAANDRTVGLFERALYEHPLPPRAEVVGRQAEFGLLEGNGNHCDIRVVQVLLTDLAAADVQGHYAPSNLPASLRQETGRRHIQLRTQADGAAGAGSRQRVKVELYSHGEGAGLDIRCR